MRVLIIGRGVIGTIYGWALSKAGVDVTHVVRKDRVPATDTLDLLDLRAGYPKHSRTTYTPKTVRQISRSDDFDIVIVATRHYQALRLFSSICPTHLARPFSYSLQIGREPTDIDRILARSSALWGYAKATGGVDARGILVATIGPRSAPGNVGRF